MAAKKKAANKKTEAKKDEETTANEQPTEDAAPKEDRDPGPYVPRHRPLQNAGLDQAAAEKKRQEELAEERRVGLLRTAGQPVN
jgi:hypothetical protein